MAIDFLGREDQGLKRKQDVPISMHQPEKEKKIKAAQAAKGKYKAPAQPASAAPVIPGVKLAEVNLMKAFRKLMIDRRLTLVAIFVIILVTTIGVIYFFITVPKPPAVVENANIIAPLPPNVNINLPLPVNENINLPLPVNENINVPLPVNENLNIPPITPPPPVILPDTELAPLRGSLIKFSSNGDIYLVEKNGELRLIDQKTVIFKNGESINQIDPSRIYVINEKFKDIRRGKDAIGFIDWDPRVLNPGELAPFL